MSARFLLLLPGTLVPHRKFTPCADDVILPDQARCLIKVVPQKETDSLTMQWPIPPQSELYATLPGGFLSHLLGYNPLASLLWKIEPQYQDQHSLTVNVLALIIVRVAHKALDLCPAF